MMAVPNKNKHVSFKEESPEVHYMIAWDFAYRDARRSRWRTDAADKYRFQLRIARCSIVLNQILSINHRENIFMSRFKNE